MAQGYNIYSGVQPAGSSAMGLSSGDPSQQPQGQPMPMAGAAQYGDPSSGVGYPNFQSPSPIQQGANGSTNIGGQAQNSGVHQNYISGGTWLDNQMGHGLNPDYLSNGALNSKAMSDPFLSGLQDYQLDRINQTLDRGNGGYHQIGTSYLGDGGVQYYYGHMPGQTGQTNQSNYFGQYTKLGGQYYSPDQYQSAIDTFNQHVKAYQAGTPYSAMSAGEISGVGRLNTANSLQDIYQQANLKWLGNQKIDPYFSDLYNSRPGAYITHESQGMKG